MLPTVTANISKIGFRHIVQKAGWLRYGISRNQGYESHLLEVLSSLCLLYRRFISKNFLQDFSFQLEQFLVSCEFNRNGWGEGLMLCFSLSVSDLLSKINATPFLGTILWIRQGSWFFECWNWIYDSKFRFTRCIVPLNAEHYLQPAKW